MAPKKVRATLDLIDFFTVAYSMLNMDLFDNKLPDCIITIVHATNYAGYHWSEAFSNKKYRATDKHRTKTEIALNADLFHERNDIQILSTLAHEMCHLQQYLLGEPGRGNYHNQEFSNMMYKIGLQTSDTGEPGGKPTGDGMTHFIIKNGAFHKWAKIFLKNHRIKWGTNITHLFPTLPATKPSDPAKLTMPPVKYKVTKAPTRAKFTCPTCGTKAYSKPSACLICCCNPAKPEEFYVMVTE